MSVSILEDDQYLIYLNSSNVETNADGTRRTADNDADFTTDIRQMSLSPNHEWVVGVIDVVIYNPNNTNSPIAPTNSQPVVIASDIGINVRNGATTDNILYITKPIATGTTQPQQLYYGEKNISTPITWRPIRNRNITNINVKVFTLFSKLPVKWDGSTGERGYNSITLCIKKVK